MLYLMDFSVTVRTANGVNCPLRHQYADFGGILVILACLDSTNKQTFLTLYWWYTNKQTFLALYW
jgi:hypothetical protein